MKTAILFLAISTSVHLVHAQNIDTTKQIRLGETITASFGGAEVHSYQLDLSNDQFVQGEVEQRSVDVVISVYDPEGQILVKVDGPARGKERFQFTGKSKGQYRVEIQAYERELGAYEISIDQVAPIASTLEGKIDQLMSLYNEETPGAVIAVRQNGKLLVEKGYGAANLEYNEMLGAQSVLYIASVSKQFTAFAILLLEQKGKLSLDDPIQKYLPKLKSISEELTIRQLIHHTSGLREYYGLLSMAGTKDDDFIRQSDVLDVIYQQQELNFPPGSRFLYCNSGYALLATIVELVSGQSFGEFMEKEVFLPLGMSNSFVGDNPDRIVKNRADSYHIGDDGIYRKYFAPNSSYGAGGILSTSEDMGKWLDNLDQPIEVHEAAISQMGQRGKLANGESIPYAFGLRWISNNGHEIIGHGGDRTGFHIYTARVPESNFSVVVMSNVDGLNPQGIAMNIINTHLPRPKKEPETIPNEEAVATPSLKRLENYVGDFSITGGTPLYITLEDQQLFARIATTPRVMLTALSDTLFKVEVPNTDVKLSFHVDSSGAVHGGTIYEGDPIGFERQSEKWEPNQEELEAMVGKFRSPEIDTICQLFVSKRQLHFRHPTHGDFPLRVKERDRFSAMGWTMKIERAANGSVTGFRASNDRVRNLLFVREK